MRTVALLGILLGACSAPQHVARRAPLPPAPPGVVAAPAPAARTDADRSPPLPVASPAASPEPVDVVVTWRTVTQVIEVPVEVPAPAAEPVGYSRPDDDYWHYRHPHPRTTWFPVGTTIGAGLGYAIGRHNGHRHRGAWIGGGLGLLFDLSRWR